MPGFFISNQRLEVKLKNRYPEHCVQEELVSSDWTVRRNTLNKFMQDKTLTETETEITVLDGYLLNKKELFDRYESTTVAELMTRMYREKGETFFSEFRGSFSGAFYDKVQDQWIVFTNHAGDHTVFYAELEHGFCAGSQANYVIDGCREAGVELTLDETAVYQMLTYAFMIDDATYAKEIRRLRGGTYLYCCNGVVSIKTYHTYSKHPERFAGSSQAEIIDAIDEAFRRAVRLEYEKDKEYGYQHMADISGGLDARMSMWVAHELGYGPIQLKTYCRGNYTDELVSKEIAKYWKDELLVKPLDDASFLYDIDENVFLTGGLSLYAGITGGNRMLRSLNMENYGLEHNGIFGGAVISSWYADVRDADRLLPTGTYSNRLLKRLEKTKTKMEQDFGDHELFLWYTRGFQGMGNTFQIRRNYLEPCAAYLDPDFIQVCMDIPVELRMHHKIHKKWIIEKYPQAAKYQWEKIHAKITDPWLIVILKRIVMHGSGKLFRTLFGASKIASGMNPLDYWIEHDEKLSAYLDEYAENAFKCPAAKMSGQLEEDMKELYRSGNAYEKIMVITALSAMKLYLKNESI